MTNKRPLTILGFIGILIAMMGCSDSSDNSARGITPPDSVVGFEQYLSSESEFLRLPMGAIAHVRDEGNPSGPAIVLLHGGYGSLHNWEPWVAILGTDYRVISMDLPAHGLTGRIQEDVYDRNTMVQLVHEVLAVLEVERFTLGGNSMGGGVALAYAVDYPEQIQALLLVAAEGIPPQEGYDSGGVFSNGDVPGPGQVVPDSILPLEQDHPSEAPPTEIMLLILELLVADAALLTPEFIERFRHILGHKGNAYATALMFTQYLASTPGERDLEPFLGFLDMPALILGGKADILVPVEVNERFYQLLPNSELRLYDDVAHLPMLEVPEQSAADVVDFLQRHDIR